MKVPWSNLKDFGGCPCEMKCGLEGKYQARAFKDGARHVLKCPCKQCTGRRYRASGHRSQRKGKKELGIVMRTPWPTGHESDDADPWENKGGRGFTGPAFRAWEKAEKQYEGTRPIGRGPLAFLRMTHPDFRYSLIVIRGDRLHDAWTRIGRNKGWLDDGWKTI